MSFAVMSFTSSVKISTLPTFVWQNFQIFFQASESFQQKWLHLTNQRRAKVEPTKYISNLKYACLIIMIEYHANKKKRRTYLFIEKKRYKKQLKIFSVIFEDFQKIFHSRPIPGLYLIFVSRFCILFSQRFRSRVKHYFAICDYASFI